MIASIIRGLCAALIVGTGHGVEPLQPDVARWQEKPISIPARQQDLRSQKTGRTYRIFVHVPTTPAPDKGFPVLFLLDGNATFPLASLVYQGMSQRAGAHGIIPGVIVGIGYPVESDIDPAGRTYDYTPPAPNLEATGDTSGHPQGGADRFLEFIEKELKPQLAADFAIDTSRQTLFGHSYGGLFTLHTLFTRPGSFQRYFAASPSVWWNKKYILTEKAEFLERKGELPALPGLRVTVGSLEQGPSPIPAADQRAKQVAERRQVDHARELVPDLHAAGLDAGFLLLENENHGSARVAALGHALRFAFAAPSRDDSPHR